MLKDGDIMPDLMFNMTLKEFKMTIDIFDKTKNQKQLIIIRQMLKHEQKVKWRKAKLRWVIKLIKSLETTTKSRGGRQSIDMSQTTADFILKQRYPEEYPDFDD